MKKNEKYDFALRLLVEKKDQLGRLPQRSDFDSQTVCFIKQKLGPWPRALEAAGLKDSSGVSSAEKSRRKREESKKRRKLLKHQKEEMLPQKKEEDQK